MHVPLISCTVITSVLAVGCLTSTDVTSPLPDGPAANAVPATVLACGAMIAQDVKLANDLVCSGDALHITADNVTLDLDGHVVTGTGTGGGITARGRRNINIRGGTIQNFVTGILVAQSTGVVLSQNRLTQNREAIFLNGASDNVVKENEAWQNQLRGIMVRPTGSGMVSARNLVKENVLRENPSGILLFGQPDNTIKENWISGSSVAALDLTGGGASGNLFKENLLETSAAAVRFGPGWTGNVFKENAIRLNACAWQGPTAGNLILENQLTGNVLEFC